LRLYKIECGVIASQQSQAKKNVLNDHVDCFFLLCSSAAFTHWLMASTLPVNDAESMQAITFIHEAFVMFW